jgi:hypothetical protein
MGVSRELSRARSHCGVAGRLSGLPTAGVL